MKKILSAVASLVLMSAAMIEAPIPNVHAQPVPALSSANQKYKKLIQVLPCPGDRSQYGEYSDYGYWGGGRWCGQNGMAGYWVWLYPNWYVWGALGNRSELPTHPFNISAVPDTHSPHFKF
ncbi:MAG: hypothetical protein WCD18_13400 [Thermosynechococcaceae cyanobacterium]